jgi:hypothetical protein
MTPRAAVAIASVGQGSYIEVGPAWYGHEKFGASFCWCGGEELNLHVLADTSS